MSTGIRPPPAVLRILGLPGFHYAASRFFGAAVARLAFDAKFGGSDRDWSRFHERPEFIDPLARQAASFGPGTARILLLGCGAAGLIGSLPDDCYRSIVGVDLSPQAIDLARGKWNSGKIRFEVGDMNAYVPAEPQDLIVLSESIYYLARRRCAGLFVRWRRENRGVTFFVTIAQPRRYAGYLRDIRKNSPAVWEDRAPVPGKPRHLIIFQ